MKICDFHNHTAFSADSETPAEEMVEKAISLGLEYLCMTDHMDLDFPHPELDFTFSVPEYFKKHQELRKKYGDRITLLTGIELGLQPGIYDELNNILKSYDFDFVIGSSHVVDRMDPYYPEFWKNRSETDGTLRYFETILENVADFDDIDVFGHIDYIVRYGPTQSIF